MSLLLAHVNGDLSFHGTTQGHSLDARVTPTWEPCCEFPANVPLRQSDYAIRPVSFAGGALRLKDDLKFNFELVARRKAGISEARNVAKRSFIVCLAIPGKIIEIDSQNRAARGCGRRGRPPQGGLGPLARTIRRSPAIGY